MSAGLTGTVLRWRLSLDHDGQARPSAGDDDEPLRNARHFLVACIPQPVSASQPDTFTAWSNRGDLLHSPDGDEVPKL